MMRRKLVAALVVAVCGLSASCAQQALTSSTACPESASDLSVQSLYGTWEATVDGQSGIATMKLERHPEYEGVRGTVERAGLPPAQLAGDINPEGQLALDESQDGKSISASWSGALQSGSCGKAFKGNWYHSSDDSNHPFVLRRSGTWK